MQFDEERAFVGEDLSSIASQTTPIRMPICSAETTAIEDKSSPTATLQRDLRCSTPGKHQAFADALDPIPNVFQVVAVLQGGDCRQGQRRKQVAGH